MKIVAVSYLNTLPFIYGLKNSRFLQDFELQLNVPSLCSESLSKNEIDIALVPVVSIAQNYNYKIVTDYCIGAEGKVDSVLLLSQKPLTEITKIHTDFDSRTSVELAKVLARDFWKIRPEWGQFEKGKSVESVVLIGDKTFQEKSQYAYCYDLSEEWFKFTGLPFVFACWVAKKDLAERICSSLNSALKYGINHIAELVENADKNILSKEELLYYYQHSISYSFDIKKQKGLQLFLEKVSN